jgi:hypothetical protein
VSFAPGSGASAGLRDEPVNHILSTGDLIVRPIADNDLDSTLEVYRESEDFLALGPIASASMSMVKADIEHSAAERGISTTGPQRIR